MFKPMFSVGFVLIAATLFATVIGVVWWGTGQYPNAVYRAVIGVLTALAAQYIEADLADRYTRRKRLPRTHRKARASRPLAERANGQPTELNATEGEA